MEGGKEESRNEVPLRGVSSTHSQRRFVPTEISNFPMMMPHMSGNTSGEGSSVFMPHLPYYHHTPDLIASRNLAPPSSYHNQLARQHPDNKRRASLARPGPLVSKVPKRVHTCARLVYVPSVVSSPIVVTTPGYKCLMKKIIRFLPLPVKLSLPSATPWGGVYNGKDFVPQSCQQIIAQKCASMPWGKPEWAHISGCFVTKTKKGQHKIGANFMGCGSLDPLHLSPHATWKNVPEDKLVYIPDPQLQMTVEQLKHYRDEALLCESEVQREIPEKAIHAGAYVDLTDDVVGKVEEEEQTKSFSDEDEEMQARSSAGCLEDWSEDNVEIDDFVSTTLDETYTAPAGRRFGIQGNMHNNTVCPPSLIHIPNNSTRSQAGCSYNPLSRKQEHSEMLLPSQPVASDLQLNQIETIQTSRSRLSQTTLDRCERPVTRLSTTLESRPLEDYAMRVDSLHEDNEAISCCLVERWCAADSILLGFENGFGHLVVDLGDNNSQFWHCFDAARKEDSECAKEVAVELNFLVGRQQAQLGLTNVMVEDEVTQVLNKLDSLNPYSKFDVQNFFNKSAMPSWQLWENLQLLVPALNLTLVENDVEAAINLFEQSPNSFAKEDYSELKILATRGDYLKWKLQTPKVVGVLTDQEDMYLKAKKKAEVAKHQLTVHQISETGLIEFRRFHEKAPPTTIEFHAGGELLAVRKLCTDAIGKKEIFPDFSARFVNITSDIHNEYISLVEHGTVDAGGLTDRLLTEAWSVLFNGSGEFHAVFERGFEISHLSTKRCDNHCARLDVQLAGQLMFLLILKKQRVNRPISMATIAIAIGNIPEKSSILIAVRNEEANMYVTDFQQLKPYEYELMKNLLKGERESRKESLEGIKEMMPFYFIKFQRLSPDMEDIEFCDAVIKIIVDVIYDTLFVRCSSVAKTFREGFLSLVNTVTSSNSVSMMQKKRILANVLKDISVEAMTTFFSAEQGINCSEFLSRVVYVGNFPNDLKGLFIQAVSQFTDPETYRLYRFITDEKYNRGTSCKIRCNRFRSGLALPTAGTCEKVLEIPHYENAEVLYKKLLLASSHMSYGEL